MGFNSAFKGLIDACKRSTAVCAQMLMELTLAVTNYCAVQTKCHSKPDTTSRARGCAAAHRIYLRRSFALHGESLTGQDMTWHHNRLSPPAVALGGLQQIAVCRRFPYCAVGYSKIFFSFNLYVLLFQTATKLLWQTVMKLFGLNYLILRLLMSYIYIYRYIWSTHSWCF